MIRKGTHVFGLLIPVFYVFVPRSITLAILLPLFIISFVIDLARITELPLWTKFGVKLVGSIIRPSEKTSFTGATYILGTDFLVILMFDKPVALCAIAFIVLGDATAAMVGRRWGYHKYGNKSFEGSFGFFIASCLPAIIIYNFYGSELPLFVGITGGLVATIVEAFSVHSDDNMTVPLISGFYMQIILALI